MQESSIQIRDQREKDWYWSNNLFIDHYGEIVGEHAVAIYSVLCRHANNDTQKCFPSMETLGRKAGIRSRKTVSKAIEILEKYNIIGVEKAQGADGKRLNNVYHLRNPKAWVHIDIVPEPGLVTEGMKDVSKDSEDFQFNIQKKEKKAKENIIVLPIWMNAEVWAEWLAYRISIKKKLTTLSILQQFKFLESNQADHVEIIRISIMNGWTGLFPLKKKNSPVKTPAAPSGKYAHLTS